jgi:plasmid stabilization system protein ParE
LESVKVEIVWDNEAFEDLSNIYQYILTKSPQGAQIVLESIIEAVDKLSYHPELFSKEEYLLHLNRNIRSFSKWDYKVIYEVINNQIRILKVFHTKQHPKEIGL